ncbi:hypothetical protein ACGYLO_16395 [Sulfitobacter sp. 1A13353]|uniref:hypothetical protein n=1 Tax=Sulfitobacter sp. 1A13353 TaxID=3368568 RepID=UPI0037467D59
MNLTILNVPQGEWARAARAAYQVHRENPDATEVEFKRRMTDDVALLVKRTSAGYIVKGKPEGWS